MNVFAVKDYFARFLSQRQVRRHFGRRHMLESLWHTNVAKDVPADLSAHLLAAARSEVPALLAQLGTHADGLTEAQADAVRQQVGLNQVQHEDRQPWWVHLWHCFNNPFNLLLTVLAGISYATHDLKATTVIGAMVVLSTSIRYAQERRSNKAADALKAMVSNTATVSRHDVVEDLADEALRGFELHLHPKGPQHVEVPIKLLVPGDVVRLSAGDMIPADARILSAKDLFVSQSALTGESLPVEKFAALREPDGANPIEAGNLVFMGTNVVSGTAAAVVVATGNRSYFGVLAERVTTTDRAPTAFQAGVNQVSWLLIRFMLVMVPLVLLINGVTKHDWLEAFLFALSIAVGLTPEMLPMIVTSTLAKGAVKMSRKQVIVKRLDAIQNFGAMDVLCTDKTGTLTQDKIFLSKHTDVFGHDSDAVVKLAYLNSYYQTGLKNLLDVAVLENVAVHHELNVSSDYAKVDEVPFDFTRRRMSVIVAERGDRHLLICKGALEEMLAACTQVQTSEDRAEAITPELLARTREVAAAFNAEGLRVVAVGMKELPTTQTVFGVADEAGLTLMGYVAFLDPPKETTAPALQALADCGVSVKVLTGDNELVSAKICHEVGLPLQGTLLGAQIDALDDAALARAVAANNIFAKLTPLHKERIVRSLRAQGHVVGFMGDGINDAPALRAADIGISVDTAVDIAKEAADIILLEKSLMVLQEGVVEGRRVFANMLKYIRMTASSNFGNVFSVLVASVFLPFLPMLPLQLLTQNLLYDVSQTGIPFDNVDDELTRQPLVWNADGLGRFMLFFGPISSVFDVLTYALMWWVFGANSAAQQTLFQSGWFVEGLLTQTLVVHMIRTPRLWVLARGNRASAQLMFTTLAVMALGVALPMGSLAWAFKMTPLPLSYFAWLAAILAGYVGLTSVMKRVYVTRYGWQ